MGNSSSGRRRRQQQDAEARRGSIRSADGPNRGSRMSPVPVIPSASPQLSSTGEGGDGAPQPPMIRLASYTATLENKICCVCGDTVEEGLGHLRLGCRCLLHDDCFVHYVRSKSKFDWIKSGGVRCPYSLGGLDCRFEGEGHYVVTPDELHQLLMLVQEAMAQNGGSITDDVTDHVSDAPITFEEIEKFRQWLNEGKDKDNAGEHVSKSGRIKGDADSAFIDVTTKPCPKCGLRSGHAHGHACHHVTGGCERCGEEYCYRCLSTETQNLRDRGDRGKCECGYWHSFCSSDDKIIDHLVYEPYPHDSRCGCTICAECRQGDPCPMCDGTCVVCKGYLEHGPIELTELPEWIKQNSKTTINAGSFFIEGATGSRSARVNGIFDLTDEVCNGMPVYRKRHDRDTWMEMVKCNAGGWRWYIKPTKEKGPDSSICFGYCSSDDVILPHMAPSDQWSVYMGSKFEKTPLRVGLSTNAEIPSNIQEMYEKRKAEYKLVREDLDRQKRRPALPGSVIIEGATVDRCKYVNGTFEPTDEVCNGMPVYRKKGEPDTWLEMVKCKGGGWRWYVKPTKERGADKSVCFGYGHHDDIVLPQDCTEGKWSVYDGNKFVVESQVTCIADPNVSPLPQKYLELVDDRRKQFALEVAALEEENQRPPKPGAVEIKGATVDRSKYVNGIFEPTCESCNDMPVYRRKGDPDTWLEMVKTNAGTWRWYVKPTKERGPDSSICFGYGCSPDIVFPQDCEKEGWHCYDDKKFVNEKMITCTLCDPELPIPQFMTELASKSKKAFDEKMQFLEEEKRREAREGSVIIEGATVDRARYVNGIFEPTKETCNGMTVYQKKGEPDTWLEVVKTNAGSWRWYIKPTKERGPDKSVCFGYGQSRSKGFPQYCRPGEWCCYDGSKFVTEQTITCTVYNPEEVAKRNIGAVNISGAIGGNGNRARYLNGTWELTDETCNGMPVYRKRGDNGTWMEMVKTTAGSWRWYIKPTKERGPDSSICFGYGVSNDVVFPHECDQENWYCYDGTSFVKESSILATLAYPNLPLPENILEMKAKKSEEYRAEKERIEREKRRSCKPGAIRIEGATVDRCKYVNGYFEPTDEVCNGMPVYQKKGEPDTWLEMVKTNAGTWRWYVKPTKERGSDKSICFGYGSSDDIVLPHHCSKGGWYVYDDTKFVVEKDVTCELVEPDSVPAHILEMARVGQLRNKADKEEREREINREPVEGSVVIQGATLDRSKFVNGIFEPTHEMCNGMPAYRKKGEAGTWLELVRTNSGWRWYVKPEKERGPENSICFGYGFCPEKLRPNECNVGEWCCYDNEKFVTEPGITCTPYETKIQGTITISGAVGGSGNRARMMNGTWEITEETCNGMPVYQKRGDPELWLDMVKTKSGTWRWYVKPTKEKGPDSSICFGYGISDNIVFPHECDAGSWFCYDGTNFVRENSISCVLTHNVALPERLVAMKEKLQREWEIEKSEQEAERIRDSKPASVIIKGSKVDRSAYVNGIFEPTDELCNGMPVYQKKGDPDTWMEMVKSNSGTWRWYIKPTKEKGADKSICFGYGSSDDVVLPQDCDPNKWHVHDATRFVLEPEVTCELISPNSVSEFMQELVVTKRISFDMEKAALMELLNSPPKPGSVTIAGATVDRSKFVNGNFERTNERCNGKPVYQKKGDPSTWLEIVKASNGGWRWYIKPTSARGPENSVCFGYGCCSKKDNPDKCTSWYVYDNVKFVFESEVTCVMEPDDDDDNCGDLNANGKGFFDHSEILMPEDMEELPECPPTPIS